MAMGPMVACGSSGDDDGDGRGDAGASADDGDGSGTGSKTGSGGRSGSGSGGKSGSGSGGKSGNGSGGKGGNADDEGGTVTYADLVSAAKLIYDDLENTEGEPDDDKAPHIDHLTSHIAGALEALGFPFIDEDELSEDEITEEIEALLDEGRPFVTTTLAYQIARAYEGGMLVDVPGYFEGLDEQGVSTLLGDLIGLQDWVGSQVYSQGLTGSLDTTAPVDPQNITAAFLWALGQERSARLEIIDDPIWGDNRLDPLQFTLLNYTILSAPGTKDRTQSFRPPKVRPAFLGKFIKKGAKDFIKEQLKDQLKDQVTDVLQDILEVPLDPLEGAQVSVCASMLLYGHKVYIENDPKEIWHKNSGSPNSTTVNLLLNFEDDYSNNTKGQVAAWLSECELPAKGYVPGKKIREWSVAGGIVGHGEFTEKDTVTDNLGTARATWETIEDNIKESCKKDDVMNYIVDGVTQAKVSGLLPNWGNLETIVTFLNPNTGAEGYASLAVRYKAQRNDRNCHYPD